MYLCSYCLAVHPSAFIGQEERRLQTRHLVVADGHKVLERLLQLLSKRNNALFIDGAKRIDDYTLVALTIMIAESKPDEKEMMIKVIMNCMG